MNCVTRVGGPLVRFAAEKPNGFRFDSAVNTKGMVSESGFKVVRTDFVRPQYDSVCVSVS